MALRLLILTLGLMQQLDAIDYVKSSWSKLELSSNVLCSVPYRDFRINIYEHSFNTREVQIRNKYYYAPIVLLDNESANSSFNKVTQQYEMRFRVQMWNDDVEQQVARYVSERIDHLIKPHQVQVIPANQVILSSTKPDVYFKLSQDWIDYSGHQELTFSLHCVTKVACDRLAEAMHSNPEQFGHFRIFIRTSSHESQTKEAVIRIENILSGELASKMLQRYSDNDVVLLTADDSKRLLRETMTNIVVESFDDTDVILPSSDTQKYNILQSMLFSSAQSIQNVEDNVWDSVFWNDDNYRPDKTSKILNKVYVKLDKSKQQLMESAYSEDSSILGKPVSMNVTSEKEDASVAGLIDIFGKDRDEFRDLDAHKFSKESLKHNVWNGEKFVPKPMRLQRFNLGKLRDRQSFQDRSVRIRYKKALLSLSLNFATRRRSIASSNDLSKLRIHLEEIENGLRNVRLSVERNHEATEKNVKDLKLLHGDTKQDIEKYMDKKIPQVQSVDRMPKSCEDLKNNGQLVSGIYMIKVENSIEIVYCDFTKHKNSVLQTQIGIVDVKKNPIYFHVQTTNTPEFRDKIHAKDCKPISKCSPITFNNMQLNEGNAMNATTGIFTAPVTGIYFFVLSGVATHSSENMIASIEISLVRNNDVIALAVAEDGYTYKNQRSPLSLQANVNMMAGDSIWLYTSNSKSSESSKTMLYFSGWLLQQL